MYQLRILFVVAALLLAAPVVAQEEPLPSGPYDPQVEPATVAPSDPSREPATADPPDPSREPATVDSIPEPKPKPKLKPKLVGIPKVYAPYFVSGARPIPLGDSALRIDLGFPDVRFAWHIPMSKTFELAPVFGVGYGLNAENAGDLALLDFRCEIKWNFFSNEEIALALFADPGLQIPVWPEAALGIVFGGPGLILDYQVIKKMRLTPAVQIPWGLYFMKGSNFAARFPFLLRLGLEYNVSQMVNLLFHMSGGADVWTSSATKGGAVSPLLRMVFGVSIRL